MNKLFALLAALVALPLMAADLADNARRHPDPECLKRDIDPEVWKKKCVVDTGPPAPPRVRNNPNLPPPKFVEPEPKPPARVYKEPAAPLAK